MIRDKKRFINTLLYEKAGHLTPAFDFFTVAFSPQPKASVDYSSRCFALLTT